MRNIDAKNLLSYLHKYWLSFEIQKFKISEVYVYDYVRFPESHFCSIIFTEVYPYIRKQLNTVYKYINIHNKGYK